MTNLNLHLGYYQTHSTVNGPGIRAVLWLQGCRLRCPGCINPELQPIHRSRTMSVTEMAASILTIPDIEGVTFSGGEPFLQAAALVELATILKTHGLSIVCYSGYPLARLQRLRDPAIAQLLAHIDLLIDGPYRQRQAATLRWRGSSNQRLHFLTQRYKAWQDMPEQAEVELSLNSQCLYSSGFWPAGFLERLQHYL